MTWDPRAANNLYQQSLNFLRECGIDADAVKAEAQRQLEAGQDMVREDLGREAAERAFQQADQTVNESLSLSREGEAAMQYQRRLRQWREMQQRQRDNIFRTMQEVNRNMMSGWSSFAGSQAPSAPATVATATTTAAHMMRMGGGGAAGVASSGVVAFIGAVVVCAVLLYIACVFFEALRRDAEERRKKRQALEAARKRALMLWEETHAKSLGPYQPFQMRQIPRKAG